MASGREKSSTESSVKIIRRSSNTRRNSPHPSASQVFMPDARSLQPKGLNVSGGPLRDRFWLRDFVVSAYDFLSQNLAHAGCGRGRRA